mmetsp:Transcript_56572/g.112331  ORF Transcript_56572/g.112331 Transcript_56572/m.112331 type:complete len:261 (-) Transcript_56572:370-1152(-)
MGTAHTVENTMYILLFLAFLLAGSKPPLPPAAVDADGILHQKADEQIYMYIRGKVMIGLIVACVDAAILCSLHVKMCLVFGVCTFWLTFVPNVGLALFVLLPMPIVLLESSFSPATVLMAFCGPLAAGLVAKDVLEPWLIGHTTSLSPVAVLMAIMLWGSVWGFTGMVLAVPMTAVARIYLAGLEHPLPRYFASVLAGSETVVDGSATRELTEGVTMSDGDTMSIEDADENLRQIRELPGAIEDGVSDAPMEIVTRSKDS